MGTLLSKFLYFFLGADFLTGALAAALAAGFFVAGTAGAGLDAEASKANRGVCEAVIDAMSRRRTQFQNQPAKTRILRSHIGMANP
jgi:hypothetical protein